MGKQTFGESFKMHTCLAGLQHTSTEKLLHESDRMQLDYANNIFTLWLHVYFNISYWLIFVILSDTKY